MSNQDIKTTLLQAKQSLDIQNGGGDKVLSGGSAQAFVRAIMDEVYKTILPRVLVVSAPDGTSISLVAGSRRLLRVASVNPENMAPADALVFEDRDDDMLQNQLNAMVGLFSDFASKSAQFRLVSLPYKEQRGVEIGFATKELIDACAAFG